MSSKKPKLPPTPSVKPLVKRSLLAGAAALGIAASCGGKQERHHLPPQVVDPPQQEQIDQEPTPDAGSFGEQPMVEPPQDEPPQDEPPQIDQRDDQIDEPQVAPPR